MHSDLHNNQIQPILEIRKTAVLDAYAQSGINESLPKRIVAADAQRAVRLHTKANGRGEAPTGQVGSDRNPAEPVVVKTEVEAVG